MLYLETIAPVVEYFRQFQNKNASSPFFGKIMLLVMLSVVEDDELIIKSNLIYSAIRADQMPVY